MSEPMQQWTLKFRGRRGVEPGQILARNARYAERVGRAVCQLKAHTGDGVVTYLGVDLTIIGDESLLESETFNAAAAAAEQKYLEA